MRRRCLGGTIIWRCRSRVAACRTPLPVETLLIPASLVRSIVLLAPLVRLLAAMVLTATERTAEIPPIRVPRMRQEANSTVAAVDRTACQTGMIAQDGIQRESDTDEQADQRDRPDANPGETKRIPRRLRQKRQVLG